MSELEMISKGTLEKYKTLNSEYNYRSLHLEDELCALKARVYDIFAENSTRVISNRPSRLVWDEIIAEATKDGTTPARKEKIADFALTLVNDGDLFTMEKNLVMPSQPITLPAQDAKNINAAYRNNANTLRKGLEFCALPPLGLLFGVPMAAPTLLFQPFLAAAANLADMKYGRKDLAETLENVFGKEGKALVEKVRKDQQGMGEGTKEPNKKEGPNESLLVEPTMSAVAKNEKEASDNRVGKQSSSVLKIEQSSMENLLKVPTHNPGKTINLPEVPKNNLNVSNAKTSQAVLSF